MRKTFPVIWALHGLTHTGKLEGFKERLELSSRGYTLSFPRGSVTQFMVERGTGKMDLRRIRETALELSRAPQ